MSRDLALAWPCPHLTMEEVVVLDPTDRQTLKTRQPIAASTTVRLLANNSFFIPQAGLFSPAELRGTVSGPFDLISGENVLTVTTPLGSFTQVFEITGTRSRLTTDQVVLALQRANFNVALASNVNGHLVFTEYSTVGPASFIKVSGTGASALGFGAATSTTDSLGYQRGAQGRQIYPGWLLYATSAQPGLRYLQFTEPVRMNPVFKATYAVAPVSCRRCGGTYVENDYRFDSLGQVIEVQNEDLLYQAALKILLTDKGSNPYHTWYGTDLRSRIGSKALSGAATLISEDVRRALGRFQGLQASQAKYQAITFKERLYAIQSVRVAQHEQDPTTFMVDVTIQNASSEPINLTIVFTVPSVVALMGSNGLMLGTEVSGTTSLVGA